MDAGLDLRLLRIAHPVPTVRTTGVRAADPYLERCWRAFLGPTATALLREVNELTGSIGSPATAIPAQQLAGMLGLGGGDVTKTNDRLRLTLERTQQFGMGRWDLASRTFELREPLPLLSPRYAAKLRERAPLAFAHHRAHLVELWDGLAQAGFDHPEHAPQLADALAWLARKHPWLAHERPALGHIDDLPRRFPPAPGPPAVAL